MRSHKLDYSKHINDKPIIVIEKPHEYEERAWFVWSDQELIDIAYKQSKNSAHPISVETIEVAKDIISNDLRLCAFLSIEEARAFAKDYKNGWGYKARFKVGRILKDYFNKGLRG